MARLRGLHDIGVAFAMKSGEDCRRDIRSRWKATPLLLGATVKRGALRLLPQWPIGYRRTPPAFTLLGPVLAALGRVEVGPAFADGRHGLGDLGVEGVNFFRLGRAGDRRASVT
jgi:hypothetical protein